MSDPADRYAELGRAIRQALEAADRTQSWLGAEVAAREGRGDPYAQAVVHDWLAGKALAPERVFAIEVALALKPGTLSGIVGYLPIGAARPATTLDMIDADPELTPQQREMVRAVYETAAAQNRARALRRGR